MSKPYFQQTAEEALRETGSGFDGLSKAEAAERLSKYGKNQLAEQKKKSIPAIFLGQFKAQRNFPVFFFQIAFGLFQRLESYVQVLLSVDISIYLQGPFCRG